MLVPKSLVRLLTILGAISALLLASCGPKSLPKSGDDDLSSKDAEFYIIRSTGGRQTETEGNGVALEIFVHGPAAGGLSYQWFKNGISIEGATESQFEISSLVIGDTGDYYAEVRHSDYPEALRGRTLELTVVVAGPGPGPESPCAGEDEGSTTALVSKVSIAAFDGGVSIPESTKEIPSLSEGSYSLYGEISMTAGDLDLFDISSSHKVQKRADGRWNKKMEVVTDPLEGVFSGNDEADLGAGRFRLANFFTVTCRAEDRSDCDDKPIEATLTICLTRVSD